ncbi:MAG: methyltransferase domain-containing protein [Acidobacteria bacterium]|nr:methyltransferase domain-containing protein [Acidobacteriota bacterium]
MRNYIFSPTRKSVFLILACLFFPNISAWAQNESLAPGINERFRQQPGLFIKQFDFTNRDPDQQKEILDACGLKPGMDVADIGAGSGVHVRLFAEKVLPAGKVYAVDILQEFLDHIDTTCKEKGIKNVLCVLGSDTSCNLEPSSVDVVFTCDTYHHFEYPFKMMASIREALRPNGKFVIIDFKDKSSHVRADSKTVIEEISKSGFNLIESGDFSQMFFLARFTVDK